MATLKMIDGREHVSGRIGNVIVVVKGGKRYLRCRPRQVKRTVSPMQKVRQQKFALASRFLRGLGPFFKMDTWDGSKTSRQKILGFTLENAVENGADGLYILYPKVSLSLGTMLMPKLKKLRVNGTGGCELQLVSSAPRECMELVLVLYDPLTDSWKWKAVDYKGNKICFAGVMAQSEVVEAWVFSRYADGSAHSDSVYIGSVFNVKN